MSSESDKPDPLSEAMRVDLATRDASQSGDGVLSYETPTPRRRVATTPAWVQMIAGFVSGAAVVTVSILMMVRVAAIPWIDTLPWACVTPILLIAAGVGIVAWVNAKTGWRRYIPLALIGGALALLVTPIAVFCGGF